MSKKEEIIKVDEKVYAYIKEQVVIKLKQYKMSDFFKDDIINDIALKVHDKKVSNKNAYINTAIYNLLNNINAREYHRYNMDNKQLMVDYDNDRYVIK